MWLTLLFGYAACGIRFSVELLVGGGMIVWLSGPRRWLQAPVCKGVGSKPTAVIVREIISHQGMARSSARRNLRFYVVFRAAVQGRMRWDAPAGSRAQGTSMRGLHVAATLQVLL